MAEEKEAEAGFLARWSRRKRLGEADAAAEDPDDAAKAAMAAAEAEARSAARAAAEAEAKANREAAEEIDLAALTYGDDFSAFLKRGVPEALRRDALRKFFNSDPLLANLDGLNDYDQDFNDPAHMVYRSSRDAIRGFLDDADELIESVGEKFASADETAERAAQEAPAEAAPETLAEASPAPEAADAPEALGPAADTPVIGKVAAVETPDPVPEAESARPPRVSLRRRLEG